MHWENEVKLKTLLAIYVMTLAAAANSQDVSQVIDLLGGVAAGGQTALAVQNGEMSPLRAAQVAAGGVNAYSNDQRAGQIAFGAVSAAQALSGGAGGAVDPTYDAISRIGSQIGPKGSDWASIGTAALSTAGSLGLYAPKRAVSTFPIAPSLSHPALAPVYKP